MSRLTANLFMNSFNENLECLKTVLKRKDLWQDLCDAYKEALCEIADRTRMDSWIASKLFLKYNYGIEVRSSKPLQPNQRALFINDKLYAIINDKLYAIINDKLYAIINVTQANAILAAKGLLWLGMIEVAASKDYKPGIWKTDVLDLRYQLFRVAGLSGFTKKALVDLSTAFGSTIRFEVVNPNSPRRIVVVKEIPISEIGNLNTFITDPNEDLWEIKKAKEDYYINKLMSLETGSLMKDATVWFDNKSMPLDTFKAKCLGQILLTGPYKVYIKRTGTQVDKLNTCNMSVTSYTVTFK